MMRTSAILITMILLLGLAAAVQAGVQPGDFAIDFTTLNVDGGMLHLYDYLGDVVVIDFSAMW